MTKETAPVDKTQRRKSIFFLVATIIGVAAVVVGVGYLMGRVSMAVGTALTAAFLVFAFHRPVDWLKKKRVPRGLGIILCYLLLFGVVALLFLVIGPVIQSQVIEFLRAVPGYVSQANDWFTDLWAKYGYLLDNSEIRSAVTAAGSSITSWAASAAQGAGNSVISSITSVVSAIATLFMGLVAGFWFLLDYHRIVHEFHVMIGPRHIRTVSAVLGICGRCIGGYCKGVLLASCCTATMACIGFFIIGEPYALSLAFLAGCMNILPVIGPWIAGIVAALIGLSVSPFVCILSIAITICAQQITDTFITPRIMSSTVQLHPGLVVIALAAGASIGGVLGMILAVPTTAAAKAIYVYFFEEKTGRQLTSDDGAFFRGDPVRDGIERPQDAAALELDASGKIPRVSDPAESETPAESEIEAASPQSDSATPASGAGAHRLHGKN